MDTTGLRVAQIGSFDPYFTTENELLHAMKRNGMEVVQFTEREPETIDELIRQLQVSPSMYDFVLWTSTKQHRDSWGTDRQWRLIQRARFHDVPIVAYHLDRWWGLDREHWLDDPYFQIDLVCTADGGHEDMWPTKGILHHWLPPGISERWCQPGNFREEYACDVLFVGNWFDYGHREWTHRHEMIDFLSRTYPRGSHGRGFRCLPKRGHPAVRGLDLNDAMWSAKVVVGDSCLVPKVDGSPMTHYCSDRVPETLGRGGLLVHPSVLGIDIYFKRFFPWELGNWSGMREIIDVIIGGYDDVAWGPRGDQNIDQFRLDQIDYVKANHTYTVRIRQLVDIMHEEGML
jgi:hypothetical protein